MSTHTYQDIHFDQTIVDQIKQGLLAGEVTIMEATDILTEQPNVLENISELQNSNNSKSKSKNLPSTSKFKTISDMTISKHTCRKILTIGVDK